MKSDRPQFLLTYLCTQCGMEGGFSDQQTPVCRYCDEPAKMTLVSKDPITPELLAARLKASTDRMMAALEGAYDALQKENIPDPDEEMELLEIMARAQKLRDHVQGLELQDLEEE